MRRLVAGGLSLGSACLDGTSYVRVDWAICREDLSIQGFDQGLLFALISLVGDGTK